MRAVREAGAGRFVAAAAAVLGLGACGGPGLDVTTWHPPALPTGDARAVHITDAEGLRASVAAAQDAAFAALRDDGWFHAVLADDTTVSVDDERNARIDGEVAAPDALYLRVDVLERYAEVSQVARDATDENGQAVTAIVDVTHGHAAIAVTLVRGDGMVILDRLELEGIHDQDGDATDEAMADAMSDAVGHVVQQMTPRSTVDHVPFDDRDQGEKPILAQAQQTSADRGDLAPAVAAEDAYIADHRPLAAPRYNRAVMLEAQREAQGAFDQALAGYDDAAAHNPDEKLRSMIHEARAHCVERRDTARSLGVS